MEMMEAQYNQVYNTSTFPPFDPNLGIIDSNYLQHIQQQRIAFAYRNQYMLSVQPPPVATSLVTSQSVVTNTGLIAAGPTTASLSVANDGNVIVVSSRPGSAASSLASNTVSQTPIALLSPNGFVATAGTIAPQHLNSLVTAAYAAGAIDTSSTGIVIPSHLSPLATATPIVAQFPASAYSAPVPFLNLDEVQLKDFVRKQIEYYLSADNLEKDFFLRRKMDKDGFLPLSLVATFPRVVSLTNDIEVVKNALSDSDKVEMNDEFKVY